MLVSTLNIKCFFCFNVLASFLYFPFYSYCSSTMASDSCHPFSLLIAIAISFFYFSLSPLRLKKSDSHRYRDSWERDIVNIFLISNLFIHIFIYLSMNLYFYLSTFPCIYFIYLFLVLSKFDSIRNILSSICSMNVSIETVYFLLENRLSLD